MAVTYYHRRHMTFEEIWFNIKHRITRMMHRVGRSCCGTAEVGHYSCRSGCECSCKSCSC
jgi:hypothetical protein